MHTTPRHLDEIAADLASTLTVFARKGYSFEVATCEEIEQARALVAEHARAVAAIAATRAALGTTFPRLGT